MPNSRRRPGPCTIIAGSARESRTALDPKQQAIKNLAHHAVCTVKMGERCPANSRCYAMRTLCNHVTKCSNEDCPVPRCHRYKKALWHMEECQAGDHCPVCAPTRQQKTAVGVGMTAGLALTPPRSPRSTIWLRDESIFATETKVPPNIIRNKSGEPVASKVSSKTASVTPTDMSNQEYPTASASTSSATLQLPSKQSPDTAVTERSAAAKSMVSSNSPWLRAEALATDTKVPPNTIMNKTGEAVASKVSSKAASVTPTDLSHQEDPTTAAAATSSTTLQLSSKQSPGAVVTDRSAAGKRMISSNTPPVAVVEVRSTPKPRHDYPPARQHYKVTLVLGVRNNREYLP